MTTRELSDLLFTPFQEEAHESMLGPWASPKPDDAGTYESNFEADRVGDVLTVTDLRTGQQFTVTVAVVPAKEPS